MNKKALFLMIIATLINSVAQIFYKFYASQLNLYIHNHNIFFIFFNYNLITALFLYFLSSLLIIRALSYERLSVVYPIISLGFVWVLLLSFLIFGEPVTINKSLGIFLIIFGVTLISRV